MGSACSCATKADVIETEGFVRYAPEPEPETRQQDFDLELCNGVGTVKTVEYFGGPLNPVTREKSFAKRSKARRGSFKAQHASPNTPGAWAAHAVDPLGSPKPDLLVRLRSRSEAWITSTASAAWARLNAWVRDLEVPDKHVIAVSVLGLLCMFGIAAALFVIGFQLTWGQAVNSGNGVTVFYNVLTCPPREVAAGGRLNNSNVSFLFSVQYAQTDDDSCGSMFSSLFPETVSEGPQFGAPSPPPLPPDNSLLESELGAVVSDREHHLVIMLREDDGYERGASYVPVVLLGPNHYAFIQFSILDALRREVYREVTLQLGPDEHYPWSTNDTTKDLDESDWAEEDWVEDVFEDLGEDLFENLIDKVADVAEDVAEDLLDPLDDVDDGLNATAEEAAEQAEEAAETAEELAEEAAEAEAEEEEAEIEAAEELGLLDHTKRYATFYWRTIRKAATCAVQPSADCDYFSPDTMSQTPSVRVRTALASLGLRTLARARSHAHVHAHAHARAMGPTRSCHPLMPPAHATHPYHPLLPPAHATHPYHPLMPPAHATHPCHPLLSHVPAHGAGPRGLLRDWRAG
jgi:hypothetical protein